MTILTRDQAIRDVLEACDGAYGVVFDETDTPVPAIEPPWWRELQRLALDPPPKPSTRPKKTRDYCAGSGELPRKGSRTETKNYYGVYVNGTCAECGRSIGLRSDGKISHHGATPGHRAITPLADERVPCPTCGAKAGERCKTIDSVQSWDGRDLGRVYATTHRKRIAAAAGAP